MTETPTAELSPEMVRTRRRHVLELIVVCIIGLIPWTVYLAVTLPNQYRARHWALTWAGFDVLLLGAMALTAYFGWRRQQAVIPAALATATLLVCDAWFDVSLDLGTSGIWVSVASAVFIELPLAFYIARRAHLLVRISVQHAYAAGGRKGAPAPPLRRMPLFGEWDSTH